ETDKQQQYQRAQQRCDDVAAERVRVEAKTRRQKRGDTGAENAYDDVADDSEAVTLDEYAGQPAGNGANQDPGDDRLWLKHCKSPLRPSLTALGAPRINLQASIWFSA